MSAKFLSHAQVLQLHDDVINRYGGSHGLRDQGLLESALAMPEAAFGGQFLHPDIATMAAAYLFHLFQNHPFLDGNKRIGAAAAVTFLWVNGVELTLSNDELSN